MLLNCESCKIVRSGDEITLPTPEAERLHLPDEELMWLQWTPHRLAALCADISYSMKTMISSQVRLVQ